MIPVVRSASLDEWERFREIRLRALAGAPDAYGSTLDAEIANPEADWRAWVQGWQGAANRVSVAEADGAWVGIAVGSRTGQEPDAHLYAMWVDPAWRRRGIGAELVAAVVAWARSWGARSVVLGVTLGNDAERVYQALGFEDAGERHRLREGSELPIAILRLQLV